MECARTEVVVWPSHAIVATPGRSQLAWECYVTCPLSTAQFADLGTLSSPNNHHLALHFHWFSPSRLVNSVKHARRQPALPAVIFYVELIVPRVPRHRPQRHFRHRAFQQHLRHRQFNSLFNTIGLAWIHTPESFDSTSGGTPHIIPRNPRRRECQQWPFPHIRRRPQNYRPLINPYKLQRLHERHR